MSKRDYYEVLGVSKNATEDEIKKSFRKLSMQYHPDRQNGKSDAEKKDAESKFKEIAEAYDVLSDKDKREKYNQFGFDGPQGFGGQDVDLGAFFRQHAGMFGDLFGDFGFGGTGFGPFGSGSSFHRNAAKSNDDNPTNGRDIQVQTQVELNECIFGSQREFDLDVDDTCSECNGSGHEKGSKPTTCSTCHGSGMVMEIQRNGFMVIQNSHPCPNCKGKGTINSNPCKKCNGSQRISNTHHIKINIPVGIHSGEKIKVAGHGEGGLNGGKTGDLYVIANVVDNKVFRRQNNMSNNLIVEQYISPLLAITGGKTDLLTPYGIKKDALVIPKGCEDGRFITIGGYGIKNSRNVAGSLNVVIRYDSIRNLTNEQLNAIEELSKTLDSKQLKNNTNQLEEFKKLYNV